MNMLEILFAICMLVVFGKLFFFGIRAAWGITKLLVTVVLFPVILLALLLGGLVYLAVPVLVIAGIIAFVAKA